MYMIRLFFYSVVFVEKFIYLVVTLVFVECYNQRFSH